MSEVEVPEDVLLGVGNPLLDICVHADSKFLEKFDLTPNNAILAEEKHHGLFEAMIRDFKPEYLAGGATQNSIRVAQWLLQRKNATTFFGGVGDDMFKNILQKKAEEVGVNVKYEVHSGDKTGCCGAIITGENRSLVTELGAAQKFTANFLEDADIWRLVEKAQFYYIGGFIVPVSPEAVVKIAKHSSENGKTLMMNLHARFICKHFTDSSLNLLSYIDVLFGNGDEALEFAHLQGFKTDNVEEIAKLTAALPKSNTKKERIVIFTQGRDPLIIAHSGKVTQYPIVPVDPSIIVDTNGCGDAFVGGFVSQLVKSKPLDECIKCGFYAAKVVIQHSGCNYPERPDFH